MRLFICGFLLTAVLAGNVKAESVASVGYQIYTLGVQAARTSDPKVREQLQQQIKLLQDRRDQLIAQGPSAAVEEAPAPVAPLAAYPVQQAAAAYPATNWSAGSYRNFRPQQGMVSNGHYGSYRVNSSPFAGTGFSLGLQPANPFTVGGYRYWKGPQFNWGSYPIRFRR